MNPLTHEWVEKAEGDWASAGRELRARKSPNYDSACFHTQQCAEKYLKAVLHAEVIPFAKTHNMATLLDMVMPVEPSWEMMRADLQSLTAMAVNFRYPGRAADKAAAREAVAIARTVRDHARLRLGLKP